MPLGDLEDEAMAKVLIVGQDQVLIENLKRELPPNDRSRPRRRQRFRSRHSSRKLPPRLHHRRLLDRPRRSAADLSKLCAATPSSPNTILIALLPDDGQPASFDRSSINETFKKPFDAALLAERLRTLIGSKKELV